MIFLGVASFFTSWDGLAVGVLTPAGPDPSVYQVVILDEGGDTVTRNMPRTAVVGMNLPVLDFGVPPAVIPESAPGTRKSRFTLHYLVQTAGAEAGEGAEKAWISLPTTTPQGLGMAVMLWVVALAIRNMAYAGSIFRIERDRTWVGQAKGQAGTVTQTTNRPRRTAPPPKSQRGPRRR